MRSTVKLDGIDDVMKTLQKEVTNIGLVTGKGLIRAVIIVRRDMDKTSPKIPVDLGNLRASFFTTSLKNGIADLMPVSFKGDNANKLGQTHAQVKARAQSVANQQGQPTVIFGFSANYAAYVHEMVGASFSRPDSGAKFLEAALKRNKDAMIKVIAEEAKLKNKKKNE